MSKRLLFVKGDLLESQVLQRELAALAKAWTLDFVNSVPEALERLKLDNYDAIVTDLDAPGMDGVQFLNEVGHLYPNIIRFIQAVEADKDQAMRGVMGAHQYLPKTSQPDILLAILTRALALDVWLANAKIKALAGRIRTFPSIPTVYMEVMRELNSPETSTQKVGEILGRDLAMTTKVLQVLNSAYYALPRKVTDLSEAVGILGFETVKSLVLCIQLFSQYDKVKPVYFSIDKLWKHSNAVARAAREIAMLESGDASLADEAFLAGLLHDIGKLVLVTNFEEQYRRAQSLAEKSRTPDWHFEQEIFGVSHGDIGAYLLGLWGMPLSLIETASLHHYPARCGNKVFAPLTAVHIANVLEHEMSREPEARDLNELDLPYLAQLDLSDRVDDWRDLLAKQADRSDILARRRMQPLPARAPEPAELETAAAAALALAVPENPSPQLAPAPEVQSAPETLEIPLPLPVRDPWRFWVPAAAGLVAILLSAFWLLGFWGGKPAARPLRDDRPPAPAASPGPLPGKGPATAINAPVQTVAPPAGDSRVLAGGKDQTSGPRGGFPPVFLSESPKAGFALAEAGGATNATNPAAAVAPRLPQWNLQGISFSATRSAAIINGRMVFAGDKIGDAQVFAIQSDSVVLDKGGEKTTLRLRK